MLGKLPFVLGVWCLLSKWWVRKNIFPISYILKKVLRCRKRKPFTQAICLRTDLDSRVLFHHYKMTSLHSWQLSYKCLDSLWFSLMALGLHCNVKQGFKQIFLTLLLIMASNWPLLMLLIAIS